MATIMVRVRGGLGRAERYPTTLGLFYRASV